LGTPVRGWGPYSEDKMDEQREAGGTVVARKEPSDWERFA